MDKPTDMTPEDWARFRGLIKDVDMPDEQKDEVILIVRNIMRVFVNQAFGLDPVQLSLENQAKLGSHRDCDPASISTTKDSRNQGDKPVGNASNPEGLSP